jgi:hypothetical protein
MFPKRPRKHVSGSFLFPFVFIILVNYWKMAITAGKSSLISFNLKILFNYSLSFITMSKFSVTKLIVTNYNPWGRGTIMHVLKLIYIYE